MSAAPDPMGQAAYATALAVDRFHQRLHIAASDAPRDERAEALTAALTQWPMICREVATLQEAAPNIARKAQDAWARLQDYKEMNG
jgi:hypothetical protein